MMRHYLEVHMGESSSTIFITFKDTIKSFINHPSNCNNQHYLPRMEFSNFNSIESIHLSNDFLLPFEPE